MTIYDIVTDTIPFYLELANHGYVYISVHSGVTFAFAITLDLSS